MTVITTDPLSLLEVVELTGRDALYNIKGDRTRIMSYSPNQKLEVEKVVFDDKSGRWWGLKRSTSNNKSYDFLSCLVKQW